MSQLHIVFSAKHEVEINSTTEPQIVYLTCSHFKDQLHSKCYHENTPISVIQNLDLHLQMNTNRIHDNCCTRAIIISVDMEYVYRTQGANTRTILSSFLHELSQLQLTPWTEKINAPVAVRSEMFGGNKLRGFCTLKCPIFSFFLYIFWYLNLSLMKKNIVSSQFL